MMFESLQQYEINIIIWMQEGFPQASEIMQWFTYLGYGPVYLVLISLVFWGLDSRLGLRLGLSVTLAGAITEIAKFAFHAPRPFWLDRSIEAHTADLSFGMPSGHALAGVAFWGLWAVSIKKGRLRGPMFALAFLIGASRVQLGVHFPSQVLAGWLFGLALVASFLLLERPISRVLNSWGTQAGILSALGAGTVLIGGGVLILAGLDPWVLPLDWISKAAAAQPVKVHIAPLVPAALVFNSSLFSGIAIGAVLSGRNQEPALSGSLFLRLLSVLTGLVGAGLASLLFLELAGPIRDAGIVSFALYGAGGLSTGLWIFWIAPGIFRRIASVVKR